MLHYHLNTIETKKTCEDKALSVFCLKLPLNSNE